MKETLHLPGIDICGPMLPGFEKILSAGALELVLELERRFGPERERLLLLREERQKEFDAGVLPGFLDETAEVRACDWTIGGIPDDLRDRRVEITGPVDRKMVINALNSGAKVFMADFEDSTSPSWINLVQGQINLNDAVRGTIEHTSPEGKHYELNAEVATLMVRPRGLHLPEKNVLVDGKPISGAFFDFALYFFHNAQALLEKGSGPYFYLPKLESHLEARLWNEVIVFAQESLGIARGTVKATVLIETITAAFEMDEILHELREHSAGLNCGRWDYIFSTIKKLRNHAQFVMPDRARVTMTSHFLRSYSRLLIETCHRRGAHAMGGMAAQIPIKNDPEANKVAMLRVIEDKEREVTDGHDGTWVAHPGLIPLARRLFDLHMPSANQVHRLTPEFEVSANDLLKTPPPEAGISEDGLRNNLRVSVLYLAAWLDGTGCVPINNLMEDAATAEIARAQIWQWIRHTNGVLDDGRNVTIVLARTLLEDELRKIETELGTEKFEAGQYTLAAKTLEDLISAEHFVDFLTLPAYDLLESRGEKHG